MPKSPYSAQERIQAVEDYLNGVRSKEQIADDLQLKNKNTIYEWTGVYQQHAQEAFNDRIDYRHYSKELKLNVIKEYLAGNSSIRSLKEKYNISSTSVLRRWIIRYNKGIEPKDYHPQREVYMADARRKTTIEQRIEIVDYCIKHGRNYREAAVKYDISYSQVYSWVKKYERTGAVGLVDHRGHRKSEEELNELENLRRENKRLQRQLEEERRGVELLKKVKEFERRRY